MGRSLVIKQLQPTRSLYELQIARLVAYRDRKVYGKMNIAGHLKSALKVESLSDQPPSPMGGAQTMNNPLFPVRFLDCLDSPWPG